MAEISPVFPQDLFICEILARLPVESIGRFRCVSKPWRSLLSSPRFLKAHRNAQIGDSSIIFRDPHNNLRFLNRAIQSCSNGGYGYASKLVKIPSVRTKNKHAYVFLEGSCHGLVLIHHSNGKGFICRFLICAAITCGLGYNILHRLVSHLF